MTCHLSLKPEKEIISTFLLLAHVYKSILNDPSAALTLTQNHGTKRGLGGGRKITKTHKKKVLNLLLCGQPWALSFKREMKNVTPPLNVKHVHFSI